MKAFVIDRYKPADGGHLADVPDPRPGPTQVLVDVHAAGVNPLDIAPNLLSERLHVLLNEGLIEQQVLEPPAARTLYALTARGLQAARVLDALARFGATQLDPTAKRRLSPERAVRCLVAAFHSPEPNAEPFRARVHVDARCVDVVTSGGAVELQQAGPTEPDIDVTTTVADLVAARQGSALRLPPGPAATRFAHLFSLETSGR